MVKYSRDEIHSFAKEIVGVMGSPGFLSQVRAAFGDTPPATEEAALEVYEAMQADHFTRQGLDGKDVMKQLTLAVNNYPDSETEKLITQLCMIEQAHLGSLVAAGRHGSGPPHTGGVAAAHGHSHNGVPCHGHGHGGGMNPMMQQQQMMQMSMAMQSLSEQQKQDMIRIQGKMMSGTMPTEEDKQTMMAIQKHILAFIGALQLLSPDAPSAPQAS